MRLVSAVQGRRMARSAAACRSRERYDSGDNLLVPRRVGGRCDGAQLRGVRATPATAGDAKSRTDAAALNPHLGRSTHTPGAFLQRNLPACAEMRSARVAEGQSLRRAFSSITFGKPAMSRRLNASSGNKPRRPAIWCTACRDASAGGAPSVQQLPGKWLRAAPPYARGQASAHLAASRAARARTSCTRHFTQVSDSCAFAALCATACAAMI